MTEPFNPQHGVSQDIGTNKLLAGVVSELTLLGDHLQASVLRFCPGQLGWTMPGLVELKKGCARLFEELLHGFLDSVQGVIDLNMALRSPGVSTPLDLRP